MTLKAISIPPQTNQPPQGMVVLLHGWGANGQDLVGLANYLDLPNYQLVFPEAPLPHPYNPVGKMWYDLPDSYAFFDSPEFGDRSDLSHSRQLLLDFLHDCSQQTGVPLSRTILGGFSQGGAMTLDLGVRLPLAGLMVLSGYLHAPLALQIEALPPVLMVHGQQDAVVPIEAARKAKASLTGLGITVEYQEYEAMGHEIQLMVLERLQNFVKAVFGNINEA
jgi:phospholipase/carboxylesterase